MKSKQTKLFLTFISAAILFCVSCSGGGSDKHSDVEETNLTDNDQIIPDGSDSDADNDTADTADDNGDTSSDTGDSEHPDTGDSTDSDTNDTGDTSDSDTGDSERPDTGDSSDSGHTDTGDTSDTDTADSGDSSDSDTSDTYDDSAIPSKEDPEVICSGLTKCYDDWHAITCPSLPEEGYFGQDAQYNSNKGYCIKQNFTKSGELIIDEVLDLVWQRNLPEKYTGCTGSSGALCSRSEAEAYCSQLSLDGRSWRLPTVKELASTVNYNEINPAVNASFAGMSGKPFWTSDKSKATLDSSWAVDFIDGKIYENKENGGSQSYLYVRCVSGNQLPQPVYTEETGSEEKVVKDSVHNLRWTRIFNSYKEWPDALKYCAELDYAGETGWRLPGVNELKVLLDYSKNSPSSNFPEMEADLFWSSTSYSYYPYNAWKVNFLKGEVLNSSKEDRAKIICVK